MSTIADTHVEKKIPVFGQDDATPQDSRSASAAHPLADPHAPRFLDSLVKNPKANQVTKKRLGQARTQGPKGTHVRFIARRIVESFHATEPPSRSRAALAPREVQVLEGIARGRRIKEVVAELELSPATVQTYLCRIYEKLQVRSQAEAVSKFLHQKPLPPGLARIAGE
jgi:DNA-binding CsgD family transcriptional regulator